LIATIEVAWNGKKEGLFMYDFRGRIAAITGAGKGLGAAIGDRLTADGIDGLVLMDIDEAAAAETAARLNNAQTKAMAVRCDVSDEASVKEAFRKATDRFGKVDILVNNAGITRDALFHKMPSEDFRKLIDIHVNGAFYCARNVVDGMREREYGRIINMSSIAAFGNVGQANYSAAKAALVGLTKTLALELGRKNITVNCIAPGMINTDIIKTVPQRVMETMVASIPMGRIGEPEEVAALAAFLASGEAGYISGQCIVCAGGK
jgi:NAD(P)-dependent dehydrogenase (short-subunit alcohol dehydrogenase family)